MDIISTLRTTGAVRAFTDEPVADAVVHEILDDARFAPSGGNRQPWRVAVVKDPTIRRPPGRVDAAGVGRLRRPRRARITPYNCVDDREPPTRRAASPTTCSTGSTTIPVVLAVAADLRLIALMDAGSTGRRSPAARRSTRSAGASCSPRAPAVSAA